MNVRFLWRMALALLVIVTSFIKVYLDNDSMMVRIFQADLLRDHESTANSISRLLNSSEYDNSVGNYRMGTLNRSALRLNLDFLHSKHLKTAESTDELIERMKSYHGSLEGRSDIQFSIYDQSSRQFIFGGDYLSALDDFHENKIKDLLHKLASNIEAFQSVDVKIGDSVVDTVDIVAQKHRATGKTIMASISRKQMRNSGVVSGSTSMKEDVSKKLIELRAERLILIYDHEGRLFATNDEKRSEAVQMSQSGQDPALFANENMHKVAVFNGNAADRSEDYFAYASTYHGYTIVVMTSQMEYARHFEMTIYIVAGVTIILLLTILYLFREFIKRGEAGWE